MDSMKDCDLLVIGGGLLGTAIARDAAGRGLSVTLCERDDLASGASSLLLSPLRSAAPGDDPLHLPTLRQSIAERDALLRCAPQVGKCVRIVMPQTAAERSGWKMRTAIRLQNHLGKGALFAPSREIDLLHHVAGGALRPEFSQGWVYSDGAVDVARLTLLNAIDAAEGGARILTRTACRSLQPGPDGWQATLRGERGQSTSLRAKAVVNATGGAIPDVLPETSPGRIAAKPQRTTQMLSKRHVGRDYGYLLRAADARQVWLLPQENGLALFSISGDDSGSAQQDIAAICDTFNRYFTARLGADDMLWSHSAVCLSPLPAPDKSRRPAPDYGLSLEAEGPPLLSVIGGSLSSHRRLAEEAVGRIAAGLGVQGGTWTTEVCLPGGDLYGASPSAQSISEFHHYVQRAKRDYAWAPAALIERYVRTYGSRIHRLLENCRSIDDLGAEVLPGLYELELRYLLQSEWAVTAADILWRRTRLGLALPADAQPKLDAWIAEATAKEFAAAV